MAAEQITINSRKFDGSVNRTWKCRLAERSGSLLVFVGQFEHEVHHPDIGLIRRDTISYEYYWLDRWYNIFRFHEPDGTLRNYYCNVNMPPEFRSGVLDYVDLDIDVLVWPDKSYKILDRDEFEANAAVFNYPPDVIRRAEAALDEIIAMIGSDSLPAWP